MSIEAFDRGDELERVLGRELFASPGVEAELMEKAFRDRRLRLGIPQWHDTSERNDPLAVDARHRRIAVHDTWQHVKIVSVAPQRERHAGPLARRGRKPFRSHVERHAFGQRR